MFRWTRQAAWACALAGVFSSPLMAAESVHPDFNLGRAATAAELQAWDIDVRPDFKGLPEGSGTVDQGLDIWESTCATCHGSFGEKNTVFTPLVGGTTPEDIETGHVASLVKGGQPSRTTFMKVPTVSTLWDYIHRAMPWDNPKSLKTDEVYAVLAYLLNLAEVVPSDFTLSDKNMAEVQEKMPNRNGMKRWDGLWNVDGKPDTHNTACMKDCDTTGKPSSELPHLARDAHGDLAAQMRIVGPVRGVDSIEPVLKGTLAENIEAARAHARTTLADASKAGAGQPADAAAPTPERISTLLSDNGCVACHARDKKVLGPSFVAVADKYNGDEAAVGKLITKIQKGGSGVWGAIPMPPHPNVTDAEARELVEWILTNTAK